jgi:hypothetical protein
MSKTRWMFLLLLSMLAISAISATVWSGTSRFDAATMKAALRTTTIEEQGFITAVLHLVDTGVLPADLVDSTFMWARKKPAKYRFQYFKFGLIFRANKLGITL